MNDHLEEQARDFSRLAVSTAKEYGLRVDEISDRGVRASLDDLLFEFTQDRGEIVVSLGSRHRPATYFAAEYVAVLLGDIPAEDLATYRKCVDEFVKSNTDGAAPPGLLRNTGWLLDWARQNARRLHKEFCHDPDAISKLDAIVDGYLGI